MSELIVSFLATLAVPIAILLAIAAVQTFVRGKSWPKGKRLTADLALSAAITVAITLMVCLLLKGTGYFESQFFQPSQKDFGVQRELGLAPEEVVFKSRDGTQLHGWFLPAAGTAKGTVIHFHGSGRNITFTVGHAAWLCEHGFNVFAFDYRGYGQSEGTPSRMGVIEDAVAAIEYVRSRTDVAPDRICLWGQSMGGQLAIVAANATGSEGIRAVVSEATYASHSHHIKDKTAQLGPLWLVQWAAWLVTSDAHSAERVVGRIAPTPLLLVHGTLDRGVLPYHSERLLAGAREPKEIWRVEGAKHLDIFREPAQRAKLAEYLTRACQDAAR